MADTSNTATDNGPEIAASANLTEAERAALAPETDAAAEKAAADAAVAKATEDAAAAEAATKAAVDAAAALSAAEVATVTAGPSLLEVPQPPKDFEAEFEKLSAERDAFLDAQEKYQANEIDEKPTFDHKGYDKAVRNLTLEQSRYEGTKATIEAENAARVQQFEQAAAQSFTDAQKSWRTENAAFMANPLRAKAMQDAINLVDAETKGKMSNADLIAKASKIAFEAHNWNPEATKGQPTAAQIAQAEALKSRQPPEAPRTVSAVPAAGTEGSGQFGHLESAGVLEQEAAYAKMSEGERNKWLAEVDGPVA
jgi:hypothetical protein